MSQKSNQGRSRNDQRADVHNPGSREHKAAADNRANQLNPQHPAHPVPGGGGTGAPSGGPAKPK